LKKERRQKEKTKNMEAGAIKERSIENKGNRA
jgi:hypothetical protein